MLKTMNMEDDYFLASYIKGLLSFPVGVSYIAYDFIDSSNRTANFNDRVRIAEMLKGGISLRNSIEKIVDIVVNDFASYVNIERIRNTAVILAGSTAGKITFSNLTGISLGRAISSRFTTSLIVGGTIGSILTLGSETTRAIYTARRLEERYPTLYYKLRRTNLDLFYFLVEDRIKPFEEACLLHDRNPTEFNAACDYFFNGEEM
ncbi:hypothetical protein MUA01_20375 [Enterobacteriaceae bacterium H18W14]|uniref:hypothetical protein n=1 Tax=Dryocola boscaweniae TaxID=2925397 RepID=UPI0022EFEC31|nr:hypothetical protein [Dryocola boscaweniae]MCT4717315.1 hypothetical protein [Dryocola boscaweniae]